MSSWSCLLSLFLWFKASSAKVDGWEAIVSSSVVGLSGSCVEIPCTFKYPAKGKTYTSFTGIWTTADHKSTVYHTDSSKITDIYRGRTRLIGDLSQNNCSLKISSLQNKDAVTLMFRIEIKDFDKFTYGDSKVSITVQTTPETPTVSVQGDLRSGKPGTATCAVLHSCPSELPQVTWSHNGEISKPSQPQNKDQWKLTTYTLTFTPSRKDHQQQLSCSAKFKEKTVTGQKTLQVQYPPQDVKVEMKASVKENETVQMTCSSDSNPVVNSYKWFNVNRTWLADGNTYSMVKVSRHTEAIFCTAKNTEGENNSSLQKINVLYPPYNVKVVTASSVKENESVALTCSSDSNPSANSYEWFSFNGTKLGKEHSIKLVFSRHTDTISCTAENTEGKNSSSPQKLNVLYPPEIKSESSCKFLGFTVCVCFVDSNPPSEVKWFGPNSSKTFTSSSTEQNQSISIVTLQGWLVFSKTVQCFASNTLGSSSITLEAPLNGIIIYSAAASAFILLLTIFFAVRRCRRKRAIEQTVMNKMSKKNEQSEQNKQNEVEINPYRFQEEKAIDESIYSNCMDSRVYDNWGDNAETLPIDSTLEDEAVYSNM